MNSILVTGGTGTLGRDVVPALRARGRQPIVLSRRRGDSGVRTADLGTGIGLARAFEGVETVVHLAAGKDQPGEARNLVAAATAAGIEHLVFISIVGIDEIPLPYYRQKLAAETVLAESGLPVTILRVTQFHSFAAGLFEAQRRLPVVLAPRLSIQPIDTRVVADELAALALDRPRGRAPDLGGPEILAGRRVAELFVASRGWRRRIVDITLPGRIWAGYAAGHHLVPLNPSGGRTFADYLAQTRG